MREELKIPVIGRDQPSNVNRVRDLNYYPIMRKMRSGGAGNASHGASPDLFRYEASRCVSAADWLKIPLHLMVSMNDIVMRKSILPSKAVA